MFGDTMTTDFAKLRAAAQKAAVNFRASEDCFLGSVGAALLAEKQARIYLSSAGAALNE